MHRKLKILLEKFSEKLKPIKKDIYSVVVHGSSVYSKELKAHQDIDLFVVFKKEDFGVLRKFGDLLKEFCRENSIEDEFVYYSIAGSGRSAIEKVTVEKDQMFRFEIFTSTEDGMKISWKGGGGFSRSLVLSYKVLMGEDIGKSVVYSGHTDSKTSFLGQFDVFQWLYCSTLEYGFDERALWAASPEVVFNSVRKLLTYYGIKEFNKNNMLPRFLSSFPDGKRFDSLFKDTMKLRKGGKLNISVFAYLEKVRKFENFIKEKLYEGTR